MIQQFHVEENGKYRCPHHESATFTPSNYVCPFCSQAIAKTQREQREIEHQDYDKVACQACGRLVNHHAVLRDGMKYVVVCKSCQETSFNHLKPWVAKVF